MIERGQGRSSPRKVGRRVAPGRLPRFPLTVVLLLIPALLAPSRAFAAASWQQQPDELIRPDARWGHSMATDFANDNVVIFGGCTTGSTACTSFRNDTWIYDPSALTKWTRIVTVNTPSPRIGASMTWAPEINKILLFGGYDGGLLQDTWTFDGTNWTPTQPEQQTLFARLGRHGCPREQQSETSHSIWRMCDPKWQ